MIAAARTTHDAPQVQRHPLNPERVNVAVTTRRGARRARTLANIGKSARRGVRIFRDAIGDADYNETTLRSWSVRGSAYRLASRRFNNAVESIVAPLVMLVFLASCVAWYTTNPLPEFVGTVALAVIFVPLFVAEVWSTKQIFSSDLAHPLAAAVSGLVYAVTSATLYFVSLGWSGGGELIHQGATGGTFLSGAFLAVMVLLFPAVYVSILIERLYALRFDPSIRWFTEALLVLAALEPEGKDQGRLADLRWKVIINRRLDTLASLLERQIPRTLRLRREGITIAESRLAEAAQYFRELKSWIVLTQPRTVDNVRMAVAGAARAMLTGYLDELPRAALEARRDVWLTRIRRFVSQVFVAALPLGALLIVEAAGVTISDEIRSTWAIGGSIWAVVVFLSMLDPEYSDKLSAAQGIFGAFRKGE